MMVHFLFPLLALTNNKPVDFLNKCTYNNGNPRQYLTIKFS